MMIDIYYYQISLRTNIIYKENAILEKISYIDDVSLDKIKNDKIYFFGRNFIGLDKKELKKYDYDKLISKQNLSNSRNF